MIKPVVRNLTPGQGIRIENQTTGSTRSLVVFEKNKNKAVLLVREKGDFFYKNRVPIDDSPKYIWNDLSVNLYQRPNGEWRFVFHIPDNLKLDRIHID